MTAQADWIQFFFSPKGRIKRFPFFICGVALNLFLWVIAAKFNLSSKDIFLKTGAWKVTGAVNPIFLLAVVLYVYSFFILMIKRLRDINRSPWLCLLYSIPFVGYIFFLYLLFAKSADRIPPSLDRNHYMDAA